MSILNASFARKLELEPNISDKKSLKKYLKDNKLLSLSLRNNAWMNQENLSTISDAIRLNAWIEPSLGIALTMHHHIVLVMAKFPEIFINTSLILEDVLQHEVLVASAFAEGQAGVNIFNPSSYLTKASDHFLLNGSKKPCSLSSIADYVVMSTASDNILTLINLPAKRIGVVSKKFWNLDIFKYCDNNELAFNNVVVTSEEISVLDQEPLSICLMYGLSLFNYFAISAYIGISDHLISFLPESIKNILNINMSLIEFNQVNDTLLVQISAICSKGVLLEQDLNCILNLRYLVECNIKNIVDFVLKNIGGLEVMMKPEILNLVNHLEMLKYHPTGKFQHYRQFV